MLPIAGFGGSVNHGHGKNRMIHWLYREGAADTIPVGTRAISGGLARSAVFEIEDHYLVKPISNPRG
jgi:hypothetical protein